MIKFFRKIRHKLLTENKFSKYLIYAFGEILLVVIGILIALNVNNFNESRKKEAKIFDALKEIHKDLSEDILESNDLIPSFSQEDSIINILMTNKLSIEDFEGLQGFTYALIAQTMYDLKINDNGYKLLMANSDNIPTKYEPLLKDLNKIYIADKNDLQETKEFSMEAITTYLSHNAKNAEWYYDLLYNQKVAPEAIDFFRNNPYFKNHLTQYFALAIANYYGNLYQFRIDAEKSYQELTNILQLENLIASDSSYYKIDANDYEQFLGTYKEDSTKTAIISMESNKLFYQWNNREKARLYPISKSMFIHTLDPSFNSILIDSLGQVISHNWHYGREQGTMTRTD